MTYSNTDFNYPSYSFLFVTKYNFVAHHHTRSVQCVIAISHQYKADGPGTGAQPCTRNDMMKKTHVPVPGDRRHHC